MKKQTADIAPAAVQIPRELDTASGTGRRVKLSPFTIRRLGYSGEIKEYRSGRAVRYDPAEVIALMAGQ